LNNKNPFVGKIALSYDKFFESDYGKKIFNLEKELLINFLKKLSISSLLEIGCGTGIWLKVFEKELNIKVFGIDISLDMLKVAKEKGLKNLILGDAKNLPFKNNLFDITMFITSLEFIENKPKALYEAMRVSKKYLGVAYLNLFSLLSLERKIKTFFKNSVYKSASFLSFGKVKNILEAEARKLGKNLKLLKRGSTLNLVTTKYINLKLEKLIGYNSPFGAFEFLIFEIN